MPAQLLDRVEERAAVDRALDAGHQGLSAALIVRGEPGVGKTSLLEYAIDSASDSHVAHIVGVESEMEFAFAGLHRLLIPFLGGIETLPTPQRSALETAFGLVDGAPANRFVTGLAALSLLAAAAVDKPLVCVVDDAQWLDRESLTALGLVGRRLYADGIVLLFGLRDSFDGQDLLEGIPAIRVGDLPEEDAYDLLASVVEGPIDRDVAERIVAETGGFPMAIVELASELSAKELAGGLPLPEQLPLSRQLEAHFLRQVRALPPATQTLVLVAAAEPTGDLQVVAEAARLLGSSAEAAEPGRAAGVLVTRGGTEFRHPLIRSAVYAGASPEERRRAHEALAAASDPDRDPDRRAWHRAAAAAGPDEGVAGELEHAAGRAKARGGYSAAGAILMRAAQLTADHHHRGERVLAAADAYLTGGAPAKARSLLEETGPLGDASQRARAQRVQGVISYALGQTQGTVSTLVDAARALEPFDVHAARATMLLALEAARVPGRFTVAGESEVDVATVARAMPLPQGSEPAVADLLLDGRTALFLDGHAAAVPLLREAIAALQADLSDSPEVLYWLGIGCWAAGAVGDDAGLHALGKRLEGKAREQGALVPLSIGLLFLAMSELFDGSLTTARAHFIERAEIIGAIGRPADVGDLVMLAWSGREIEARAEAAAVTRFATEHGQGWMLVFVDYALGVLDVALGNYRVAFTRATRNYKENPFLSISAFPNLIEAAARCGEWAAAAEAVEEFAARAIPNGTSAALGLLARSRALLADDGDAEKLYLEAIERLSLCRGDLQVARVHLLYGEWLRRQKRRLDARDQLRTAHEMFVAMGADAFASRARSELAATGERARKRNVETGNDLTPQEAQIALLASKGATNPEIAAKLFLSASTVDYHLRKVYRKLDVTSRRQLGRALPV